MTSAYILISAILILGGLIAVLGDRVGSKVGKARLRLFNLRPRQTAMVVTVLTGTAIAASTLSILFTLSESLRKGVFELDEILQKRRKLEEELIIVTSEKNRVNQELLKTKSQQVEVQKYLEEINQKFQQAQEKLKDVSSRAEILRSEINFLQKQQQQLSKQRDLLKQQLTQFREQLQNRDLQLAEREQKIAAQNKVIKQKEKNLQQLEKQQQILLGKWAFLEQEVKDLGQSYQKLRGKKITVLRDQVLAFASVRIAEPQVATEAIDRLLWEANRAAIKASDFSEKEEPNKLVVKITKAQVQQLIQQVKDGREYVVRILSAGNYVQGEKEIRVFADVALNQQVFLAGETLAAVSLESETMSLETLKQRLDWLLAASQFRARSSGILGEIQLEDGSFTNLINFIQQLNGSEESPEEIKAIASDKTYTIGPLKLRLIAVRDGEIIF